MSKSDLESNEGRPDNLVAVDIHPVRNSTGAWPCSPTMSGIDGVDNESDVNGMRLSLGVLPHKRDGDDDATLVQNSSGTATQNSDEKKNYQDRVIYVRLYHAHESCMCPDNASDRSTGTRMTLAIQLIFPVHKNG